MTINSTVSLTVVTEVEFLQIVRKTWVLEMQEGNYSTDAIFTLLVENGFPKYDKDHIDTFVKDLNLPLPAMVVNIGDCMFGWLVYRNHALIIPMQSSELLSSEMFETFYSKLTT